MSVFCPHCHAPCPQPPRAPGQHRPRCPGCAALFALVVPADAAEPWHACFLADAPADDRAVPIRLESLPFLEPVSAGGPALLSLPRLTPPAARPQPGSVPDSDELPATLTKPLPGYTVERVLGHGGMGTVYLARQLSLDRPVALKVMSRRWAADPVFVARFVREAYAAALLNHPNVVQIYDIGEHAGVRFFSMEYVAGRSLAEVMKVEGALEPEAAVGYVLQAARGLKHAHDRGLIHRDVKPDNLLLNAQGLLKVADLGLVKTPDSRPHPGNVVTPAPAPDGGAGLATLPPDMTEARVALGTPAYMAPEQCRDAAAVDHRADIYSLGATLYALVTGQQPFEGGSAVELMTQHAYRPLVPPEQLVARVPRDLSAVIQKMMAKDPEGRYPELGELIRVLEQWLGVARPGAFVPRSEQVEALERCVRLFERSPAGVRRGRVVAGGLFAALFAAVAALFAGHLAPAFGLAGMVLQGALAYFLLNGWAHQTDLYRRVRWFVGGLTGSDWLVAGVGLTLAGSLLLVLGLLDVWLLGGAAGALLAAAVRLGLDRRVDRERAVPLAACQELLRRLRLQGVDEDDLRLFVARHAGRDWEEFFEALFGLDAKLSARAVVWQAGRGGPRNRFGTWREPILEWLVRLDRRRQDGRERDLLERVERARLLAAGVEELSAQHRAASAADALVQRALRVRAAEARPDDGRPLTLGAILGRSPLPPEPPAPRSGRAERIGLALVGTAARGVAAAVLLAAFLVWVYQNGLFADPALLQPPPVAGVAAESRGRDLRPLQVAGVPPAWTAWCNSSNVGWAGVLLLGSLFYRGARMGAVVVAGAVVTLIGPALGLRGGPPLGEQHVAMMLGTMAAVVGFRLAEGEAG